MGIVQNSSLVTEYLDKFSTGYLAKCRVPGKISGQTIGYLDKYPNGYPALDTEIDIRLDGWAISKCRELIYVWP